MAETPNWPAYQTGPKDSIFALGVMSANYARLDFAVHAMFATVIGLPGPLAARVMFKMSAEVRDKLMKEVLPTRGWPEEVNDLVLHFLAFYKRCNENRNKLMHSNLIAGPKSTTVLYKTERDGTTTLTGRSTEELRKVADDMMMLFDYGLHLSNMINLNLLGAQPQAGDLVYHAWPGKPALPNHLEYTSDLPQSPPE